MKKKNIIILTIILLIVLIAGAYGKAMTVIKGKGYFIIAKPICETEIEETSQTDSLGSYYNVKIKNYNADNEVSMVNSDYEVIVEQADGDELPDYYWYDQDENIIGKKLTGSLQHTDKQEKIYKFVFCTNSLELEDCHVFPPSKLYGFWSNVILLFSGPVIVTVTELAGFVDNPVIAVISASIHSWSDFCVAFVEIFI